MKLSENKDLKSVLSNENSSIDEICESIENVIENKIEMKKEGSTMNNRISSEEIKYINALCESLTMKQQMAVEDSHMPHATKWAIFDAIQEKSPIIGMLDRLAVKQAVVDMVFNDTDIQQAAWGNLGGAITKEIEEAIKVEQVTLRKLGAYGQLSNDLLKVEAGDMRGLLVKLLSEAFAVALEDGLVNGNGDFPGLMPPPEVGVGKGDKITDLSKATLNPYIYSIQKDIKGRFNKKDLVLICNPQDFYEKVEPAIMVQGVNGQEVNIAPMPIIQVNAVPQGSMIMIAPKDITFMINHDLKIEHSDTFKFLDDLTVFKGTMLCNFYRKPTGGMVLFDITELKPAVIKVKHEE